MDSSYQYQFPSINRDELTLRSQVNKINEESEEVSLALVDLFSDPTNMVENIEHLLEETLDTIQACETLLRWVKNDALVEKMKHRVIAKNLDRGYYNW